MTIHDEILAQSELVRAALGTKLRIKGRTLGQAVTRAGRLLPRHIRNQAEVIVDALHLAGHPKTIPMVDQGAVKAAVAEVQGFLNTIDPKDRRRAWWLGVAGGVAFNLLVVLGLFFTWLAWSGHL